MTTWASPQYFLLIIPLIATLAWIYLNRSRRTAALQFSSLQRFKTVPRGVRAHLAVLVPALKVMAILLAIVALARPQRADTRIKRNVEGIDIMIVLDVSDSMLIEDMKPENRLVSSKQTIREFIQKRVSDRIGLVVFSGESYTRVPLTLDYPLLLKSLEEVQTTRNIKMGTAIGVALANAVARIKDSTAKSRIIVFLTDGENNSGTIDPETALTIAKGYGLKIYSIGMGKDGQAQLPIIVDGPGGQKIKTYRPIHSTINEELLGRFASGTGGKFWRAETGGALASVFKEIDALEKTKIEVNQYTKYHELFFVWVKWALLAFFAAQILSQTLLRRAP